MICICGYKCYTINSLIYFTEDGDLFSGIRVLVLKPNVVQGKEHQDKHAFKAENHMTSCYM